MKANEVTPSTIKAERLQTRANTSAEYVDELAERMVAGDVFPPIVIFCDGKDSWLADGIHRIDAAIKAKRKIGVDQRRGSRADAVEFACGANAAHGMRRSNADKKRSVMLALSTFQDRSSRSIAELCGVSHTFVEAIRSNGQVATVATSSPRVGRDGKKQPSARRPPTEPKDKATDFDPATFKQPKPGTQKRKPADRKAALLLLGKLIRALDKLGLSADLDSELKAINKALKES